MGKIYTEPVLHSAYNLFQFFYFRVDGIHHPCLVQIGTDTETQSTSTHPEAEHMAGLLDFFFFSMFWFTLRFRPGSENTKRWFFISSKTVQNTSNRVSVLCFRLFSGSSGAFVLEPAKFSPLVWLVQAYMNMLIVLVSTELVRDCLN